tara:strand:+ start:259 stop:528 length:270 start_codon:yes stop_codon:yes gene_type:complete
MGLKDQLANAGSNLTQYDGATPPTPVSATQSSRLHNQYSINGDPFIQKKPNPSTLDLDGVNPSGPLSVPGYGQMNDSFKNGEYLNNLPG